MIIDFIQLKNYRPYLDTKIDFSSTERKNFIIIVAENGKGKTSLMSAITWCLYGEELHLDKKGLTEFPIYNVNSASQLKESGELPVEVEIGFSEVDKQWTVKRTQQFRKKEGEKELRKVQGEMFDVMSKERGKSWVSHQNPNVFVERYFPRSINEYFFFNGERLDDYFKETSRDAIEREVNKIAQIDLLDSLIGHLESINRDFIKNLKISNPRIEEAQSEYDMWDKSIQSQKEELEGLRRQLREFEKDEKELQKDYDRCNITELKELNTKRTALEEEIKRLQSQLDELYEERLDLLVSEAPRILCLPALKTTRDLLRQKEEAKELPPSYKKIFIVSCRLEYCRPLACMMKRRQ